MQRKQSGQALSRLPKTTLIIAGMVFSLIAVVPALFLSLSAVLTVVAGFGPHRNALGWIYVVSAVTLHPLGAWSISTAYRRMQRGDAQAALRYGWSPGVVLFAWYGLFLLLVRG